MLGPKPDNPAAISFAPECFEEVGSRSEYRVVHFLGACYPLHCATREEAVAEARRRGWFVTETTSPVRRRIRWTLAEAGR